MSEDLDQDITLLASRVEGGSVLFVNIGDKHRILLAQTMDRGADSGRPRWCVVCLTCEKLLHANTTGVDARVRQHLRERA